MKLHYVIFAILFVFLLLPQTSGSHSSFEGLAIRTYDGLVLKSLWIYTIAYTNQSIMISLYSQLDTNGSEPMAEIRFIFDSETIPTSLGNASVTIDLVYYFVNSGKNVEWGTYYKSLFVEPQILSNAVLYRIDLREEANNVLSFFSSKVSNLTIEDVGFSGAFYLEAQFANSTSIGANKNYIRYSLSCNGAMNTVIADFTIPGEADLVDATWGTEEMVRITPTWVRTIFSVSPDQGIGKEMYVSWKMPDLPQPEWHEQIPWKWIWPQGLYLLLGALLGHIYTIYKFIKKKLKGKMHPPGAPTCFE